MLRMFSYPRRPKSGQITCYLNRTYHVLTTDSFQLVDLFSLASLRCTLHKGCPEELSIFLQIRQGSVTGDRENGPSSSQCVDPQIRSYFRLPVLGADRPGMGGTCQNPSGSTGGRSSHRRRSR